MANIRFVKPPNDNRIRSLPVVGITSSSVPKENFFITSAAPKINNAIHITTSKQRNYTDPTDLFITSKNNNYRLEMSSSLVDEEKVCNSNNIHDNNIGQTNINFDSRRRQSFQNLSSNSTFTTNQNPQQKVMNSNVTSELSADDNHNSNSSSMAERNNNIFNEDFRDRTESCSKQNNGNATETASSIQEIHDEYKTNNCPMLMESHKNEGESKSPLTNVDSDQNDDLQEDVDQFPELQSLFSNIESQTCQENTPMLLQQSDQQKRHSKDVQDTQLITSTSAESPSAASPSAAAAASLDRQKQQLSHIFQTGARNRHPRSYRPIHRSISDAALIENNRLTSFFRSITDDKYYGLDEEDYDDDDTDINLLETSDSIKKNELRRLTQPSKVAWEASSLNHRAVSVCDRTTEKITQQEPGKPLLSRSGEGHAMFSRSLSGDSMTADRLRIRRCALADPENMIMRQEVREKIERDVERRRTSMVRKISQFFNVHLGLNKEEDLI